VVNIFIHLDILYSTNKITHLTANVNNI